MAKKSTVRYKNAKTVGFIANEWFFRLFNKKQSELFLHIQNKAVYLQVETKNVNIVD